MKRLVFTVGSFLAAVLCLATARAEADVMDKAAFEKTLAQIQAAAQESATQEANDVLLGPLAALAYGPESLEPFLAALGALSATEAGVFTASRLLAPLLSTDAELVRKAVPAVLAAHAKLVKYQSLATYSDRDLKAMDLPPSPDPKAPPDVNLKLLSDYAQRRSRRLEAEGKVYRGNVQTMLFERMVWRVLLRTGQASEDDRVLAAVAKSEQEHLTTYRLPLEALIQQAPQLDQARAARLRAALEKQGRAMEMAEGNYVNPSDVHLGTITNSYFGAPICRPGLDILTTANVLAPVAQAPPVAMASPEEVHARTLVGKFKALTGGRKPGQEASRILEDLFANYSYTKAVQDPAIANYAESEAATLLNSARSEAASGKKDQARKDLYTILRSYPRTRAAQDAMVRDFAETEAAALLARGKAGRGDEAKKAFETILTVFPKTKAAEDPAVKAYADAEAEDLLRTANTDLRLKRVGQARRGLLTILHVYPMAKAAPEAQKLLDSIPYRFW